MAAAVLELPFGGWDVDEKGQRSTQRKWLVYNDITLNELTSIAEIPVDRYDFHPLDAGSIAKTLTSKPYPDEYARGSYLVTVSYDSKPFESGSQGSDASDGGNEDPPARPWTIKYGSVHLDKPLGPKDFSTPPKEVKNSAGQPFEGLKCSHSHMLITISGWKTLVSISPPIKVQAFQDSVNESAWQGYAARTLRVNEFSFESSFENAAFYWKFDLVLEHNPETWDYKVVDMGTHKIVSMSLPPQPILDATGNPVQPPGVPIKDGVELAADQPLEILTFRPYKVVDWTGII